MKQCYPADRSEAIVSPGVGGDWATPTAGTHVSVRSGSMISAAEDPLGENRQAGTRSTMPLPPKAGRKEGEPRSGISPANDGAMVRGGRRRRTPPPAHRRCRREPIAGTIWAVEVRPQRGKTLGSLGETACASQSFRS